MLKDLASSSLNILTLGARDHAALHHGQNKLISDALSRDKHTCHICGSRCHAAMEVDHVGGHSQAKTGSLRAICQFCHNLKHPLWSGARKRILPILAPDVSQADLNRLAWVLLAWRGVEASPIDCDKIIDVLEQRQQDFEDKTGCGSAEALFEAALTVMDSDQLGKTEGMRVLELADGFTRFWPAELTSGYEDLDPASRLSRWDVGGFVVIADEVAKNIRDDLKIDVERIRGLMEKIKGSA